MSGTLKPPSAPGLFSDEAARLRQFTRTPRPYFHDGLEVRQDGYDTHDELDPRGRDGIPEQGRGDRAAHPDPWSGRGRGQVSVAGSESGTEADDERPNFVKALPAPTLRPRKGLKTGEQNEDALLTPSQLDDEGRKLSQDYFGVSHDGKTSEEEYHAEQERVQRRRLAEFVRRLSEVALMVFLLASVLCGRGVRQQAWRFRWELLSHVVTIAALVLAYPVKLSIVDTQARHNELWERFRVPASFDPATVLYPPLLPVLVALSVSPSNPAVILPNIILGLASLPQRLFPRSSRLGGFNAVHWLVSIIPLIAFESVRSSRSDYTYTLSSEALVSLYPLHHALLQPLHYLTQTSLLVSELHLLSVTLINLLLLADSPQMVILKACLWIGGATTFVLCGPVLHWNVTLARVPKWKLRRSGHSARERKSLVDAVYEIINLQRATGVFRSQDAVDSDADEDEPQVSIKRKGDVMLRLRTVGLDSGLFPHQAPMSAVESGNLTNGGFPIAKELNRHRRYTVAEGEAVRNAPKPLITHRKGRSHHLLWCLQLTPHDANVRKWLYAIYTYLAVVAIVLGPVRRYVLKKALMGQEPVLWAVGYLFGQITPLRSFLSVLVPAGWIPWPALPAGWRDVFYAFPPDINAIRGVLGPANVRLLLVGYWAVVLLVGLLTVFNLTAYVEVDTRRKVFHGVMVAMLLPSVFVDPCYCALALAVALAVFLLLEVIRAGQVPPLGNAISRFVAPYVDGRDLRGPVVVSHIFLLIGCAVPLWLSLASIYRGGDRPWTDWELAGNQREVSMVSGVVCVGMGDAAASLIGRRYGRHKWIWVGGKSLEGSAAFAAAVTVGLMVAKTWQVFGCWNDTTQPLASHLGRHGTSRFASAWLVSLLKSAVCACGASFMEAVLTGANDNVVVPVALWLLAKGLRI